VLLGDLDSDARNVILTLARIWSTVATDDYVVAEIERLAAHA
jgi:hypothetical protein